MFKWKVGKVGRLGRKERNGKQEVKDEDGEQSDDILDHNNIIDRLVTHTFSRQYTDLLDTEDTFLYSRQGC